VTQPIDDMVEDATGLWRMPLACQAGGARTSKSTPLRVRVRVDVYLLVSRLRVSNTFDDLLQLVPDGRTPLLNRFSSNLKPLPIGSKQGHSLKLISIVHQIFSM
jgi:hypothetical protein